MEKDLFKLLRGNVENMLENGYLNQDGEYVPLGPKELSSIGSLALKMIEIENQRSPKKADTNLVAFPSIPAQ